MKAIITLLAVAVLLLGAVAYRAMAPEHFSYIIIAPSDEQFQSVPRPVAAALESAVSRIRGGLSERPCRLGDWRGCPRIGSLVPRPRG
jgi:hypothetical protein